MKQAFFLLLIFTLGGFSFGFGQSWQSLGPTAGMVSYPNGWDVRPSIITDTAGNPYVSYSIVNDSLEIVVKRYDGASWMQVGDTSSFLRGTQTALAFSKKDSLFLGMLHTWDHTVRVYRYNGSNWSMVGNPFPYIGPGASETSLAIDTLGRIFFGYNAGTNASIGNIITFDGSNWVPVGNTSFLSHTSRISLRISPQNELYVGYNNYYGTGAGGLFSRIQKYNGVSWDTVGPAIPSYLYNIDLAPDGTPYIAHSTLVTVEKLVNNNWDPVGMTSNIPGYTGIGLGDYGWHLAIDKSGVPYVAYSEGNVSIGAVASVKKFDGTSWVQVGAHGFTYTSAVDARLAFGKSRIFIAYSDNQTWNNKVYCMYWDETSGITALDTSHLIVYPNPCSGRVTINTANKKYSEVIITDVAGKKVFHKKVDASAPLSLDLNLQTGIYFIHLSNRFETVVTKLVIQR